MTSLQIAEIARRLTASAKRACLNMTDDWQKWNRENGPEQDWCARAHFDAGWDAALAALGVK